MVNLGPIALFSNDKLTTSSREHLEEISHAHIVCLMYKLITSARGCDDLSIGFDRDRKKKQRELNNNKNMKGKKHVRIMLKDTIGFTEYVEKGTYGLGYKLLLTRNNDNAVLNKGNAVNSGKIKINDFEWFVPHYTPSITQQHILLNQIIKKKATELQYPEKSVLMKEVNTQNFCSFGLATQESINIPIWIFIVFQQNDREHDQNLNNYTFCRLPVTSAQCIFGTEKILILLFY